MQLLNYSLQITCVRELPGPAFLKYTPKKQKRPPKDLPKWLCTLHTQSNAESKQAEVEPFFSTPAHTLITDNLWEMKNRAKQQHKLHWLKMQQSACRASARETLNSFIRKICHSSWQWHASTDRISTSEQNVTTQETKLRLFGKEW